LDVLIISTDEACTETLGGALRSLGDEVVFSGTGNAARTWLGKCSAGRIPLVAVIDADAISRNPERYLAEIRRDYPQIAVFATSAAPGASLLIRSIRLRIREFVPKPFDADRFASIIHTMGETSEESFFGGEESKKPETGDPTLAGSKETARDLVRVNQQLKALNKTLRQQVSQLTILYQMGRDISQNENWSDALDRFLMALVNYTRADGAALLLFSREETRLAPRSNFQVDTARLDSACETLAAQWRDNPRGGEIHSIESYHNRLFNTCLERLKPWKFTVVPLKHRNRSWGFLFIEKRYGTGRVFKADYPFLTTIQTILAEEVANASYISELRQLGRFNRKVLENINSGVITTDLDGQVAYFNHLAGEMCPRLGGHRQEASRFNAIFRCHKLGEDFFEAIMRSDEDTQLLEIECVGTGERTFPARLSISKMYDDNLNGNVLVGIFEDLTDQKRLETEIRRNDRLRVLGQLSAGVAHEIRNPLTGIATSAELLDGKIKDKNKSKYIRAIRDETNRLDEIIKNLLNFARPPKPRMGRCALGDISRRVINLLSDEAGKKRIELELNDNAADDVCTADANQMTQVLLNIVLNGIQACEEGSRIEIKLSKEKGDAGSGDGYARVDIWDNGTGVPADIRGSLFDPFVTTKSQGTGLGLAISQQIVEEHNGTIACEFLTQGTRFTIRLPAGDKDVRSGARLTRSAGER
jgi:signal transduction histidine kinase/DNA-binding NarL/FixJ family response regulator